MHTANKQTPQTLVELTESELTSVAGGLLSRGQDGSDLLIVNNGDGSDFLEGGEDIDTVQVNGSNTAGDSFRIDPNGERVR